MSVQDIFSVVPRILPLLSGSNLRTGCMTKQVPWAAFDAAVLRRSSDRWVRRPRRSFPPSTQALGGQIATGPTFPSRGCRAKMSTSAGSTRRSTFPSAQARSEMPTVRAALGDDRVGDDGGRMHDRVLPMAGRCDR